MRLLPPRAVFTLLILVVLAPVSACSPAPPLAAAPVTATASPAPVNSAAGGAPVGVPPADTPPATRVAEKIPPAAITPEASPTLASAGVEICSPLEGVPAGALPEMISNPYHPPRAGSDDPHQGLDFADRSGPEGMALPGKPVLAALPGVVAALVQDRFPYGNALIIESPLSSLSSDWLEALNLPEPIPPIQPISLTCPEVPELNLGNGPERSLYLLYAHMQAPPTLQAGDPVSCGQGLGAVGSSGNALNPHLHLEVRVGPAGARLGSLAHYDASASAAEMAAYCAWRVRGIFQTLDPLSIFPKD